ncbi:N-acyl-D-amino-acid deacylase family protein [Phenylobacterium montanum]|uniref:Amidohydrolase family protein n=1 Tax=Phenylobacterium montanum TaxID=2823693 RepID=A0A975IVE9_9CAUL|nr:amidohydrolase family protein [Caulobacter sp. S6]QUD88773.1 amidohydrolase family protein [Caulobacter sp. S6]
MYDRIIRSATVVDGTGAEPFTADVAIADGMIVEVGKISAAAHETINADGLLLTPGWVDIHSHYDGQITWDSQLAPSFWHGVTTTIMGNCGVGFAPVKPDRREWLIGLMEGVEDIPGTALSDGIQWEWETFPEYLDALRARSFAIDVGAQTTHGALRAYVMGERGAMNEPATPEDIEAMAALVREGQRAGAFGFSTSRTVIHRATDGEPVPGTYATVEELTAFARALTDTGGGVMEAVTAGLLGEDITAPPHELAWMNQISAATGCPITFLCGQNHVQPNWWRDQLQACIEGRERGAQVTPQVFCRSIGIVVCLRSRHHPFIHSEAWLSLSDLPHEERVRRLKTDEALRTAVTGQGMNNILGAVGGFSQWNGIYPLGTNPNYEPEPATTISAIAKREGRDPREVALDILLENEGEGFLHRPIMGYAKGSLDPTYELLASPYTVLGGGDGGAHVATICDAGAPTFLLTHWVRDRSRGPRLTLEHMVRKQTWDAAKLYGINDRGRIAPGLRADINLIDFDRLGYRPIRMLNDLPSGAERLMQKADGYVMTMVKGEVIQAEGEDTGARPGRLMHREAVGGTGRGGGNHASFRA